MHGPLIATLLVDLLQRQIPEASLVSFSFRAVKPLFDISPFQVCGRREADGRNVQLWAQNSDGALAMEASAVLA